MIMRKEATKDVTDKEMEECERDIASTEKALKDLKNAVLPSQVKEETRERLHTKLDSLKKRLELFKKPGRSIKG